MIEQQFEGRSVAEAAIKACEVLGMTRSALRYRVVSENGESFDRHVVIAVQAPKASKEPASSVYSGSAVGSYVSGVSAAPVVLSERSERVETKAQLDKPAPEERQGSALWNDGEQRDKPRRTDRYRSDRDRGKPGGRSGPLRAQGRSKPRTPLKDDGIDALLKMDASHHEPLPKRAALEARSGRAKRAIEIVGDLTRLMGFRLQAQLMAENGGEIQIDLVGEDESRAVGHKGEVLLALQFILNRLLIHSAEEGGQIVVLDVGGYRERRWLALQNLARRLATRALQEHKAVRLSPMSPSDRRVFHMALKEMTGVRTRSQGEGMYRYLLIIPAEA